MFLREINGEKKGEEEEEKSVGEMPSIHPSIHREGKERRERNRVFLFFPRKKRREKKGREETRARFSLIIAVVSATWRKHSRLPREQPREIERERRATYSLTVPCGNRSLPSPLPFTLLLFFLRSVTFAPSPHGFSANLFLIRSSTRGRGGGGAKFNFSRPLSPRTGTGRKRYRAVREGRKRVFQLSNRIRLVRCFFFCSSRIEEEIDRRRGGGGRKKRDRIESIDGEKDFVRRNRVSPFFLFFCKCQTTSSPPPVAVFSPPFRPTNGNDSLFIGRASRRDPISLAHHYCSRLSKIYPIVGTLVPSPPPPPIHRYPTSLFLFEDPHSFPVRPRNRNRWPLISEERRTLATAFRHS